jgi:hypothetical protein
MQVNYDATLMSNNYFKFNFKVGKNNYSAMTQYPQEFLDKVKESSAIVLQNLKANNAYTPANYTAAVSKIIQQLDQNVD